MNINRRNAILSTIAVGAALTIPSIPGCEQLPPPQVAKKVRGIISAHGYSHAWGRDWLETSIYPAELSKHNLHEMDNVKIIYRWETNAPMSLITENHIDFLTGGTHYYYKHVYEPSFLGHWGEGEYTKNEWSDGDKWAKHVSVEWKNRYRLKELNG